MTRNNDFDCITCINCDSEIASSHHSRLFCSELCQQEASFVRRCRRYNKDGRINDPESQLYMFIEFAHIASGGYPAKERTIKTSTREAVYERDKGICQVCGEEGTEIDHISGDSSEQENLQLLCKECHLLKTFSRMRTVTENDENFDEFNELKKRLWKRIEARKPKRLCDDEENWTKIYRKMIQERRLLDPTLRNVISSIISMKQQGLTNKNIADDLNKNCINPLSGSDVWNRRKVSYVFSKYKDKLDL